MTSIRTPAPAPINGMRSAQLKRMEVELARIVGVRGTQALLARSRHLCGTKEPSGARLLRRLLHLVRKLLGKPLAHWLLQSATRAQPVRLDSR